MAYSLGFAGASTELPWMRPIASFGNLTQALLQPKEKRDGPGILILPNDCLKLPIYVVMVARAPHDGLMLRDEVGAS